MNNSFLFAGYQLRYVDLNKFSGTLADTINKLYLPDNEKMKDEFKSIMESLFIPFFITNKKSLVQMCNLCLNDNIEKDKEVRAFRCAILKEDVKNAYCEFYNGKNNLVKVSYDYVYKIKEPDIKYQHLGLDVLDANEGGGSDSAMNTYKVGADKINSNKLIDDFEQALSIRKQISTDLPEHSPFTVWEVGLLPKCSDILEGERGRCLKY